MSVRVVRLGSPRGKNEGLRLGTVRRPPRGVPKARIGQWYDLWLPQLAPSAPLVKMGLAAKTAESAGFAAVPLIMLPFLSSAIVPADKMGPGIRQFAEYQPFTPIIESLRGLLNGAPHTGDLIAAFAWCLGIAVVGYLWATATFKKRA